MLERGKYTPEIQTNITVELSCTQREYRTIAGNLMYGLEEATQKQVAGDFDTSPDIIDEGVTPRRKAVVQIIKQAGIQDQFHALHYLNAGIPELIEPQKMQKLFEQANLMGDTELLHKLEYPYGPVQKSDGRTIESRKELPPPTASS